MTQNTKQARSNQPLRAILWDLDGVLIDSEPGYFWAIGDMMRSLGYTYGKEESAKVAGTSFKNVVEILALDEPPQKVQALYIEALMSAVKTQVSGLIAGAAAFLDQLQAQGIPMALGSSSPRQLVDLVVERFNLAPWMSAIVTGDDAQSGKPSPEIFLKCAALLGVEPQDCLVIEDSLNGIQAAKNANMAVCAFTGTNHQGLDLSAADFSIDSYSDENLKILIKMMGR